MKMSEAMLSVFGKREPRCPTEADVLAFFENKVSTLRRSRLQRHFSRCDDCRELLAFLGREPVEAPAAVTEQAVIEQTNRVLALIQEDDRKRYARAPRSRVAGGLSLSYPKLAIVGLIVCAIAAGAIFLLNRSQPPAVAAMEALALAVKDGRNTEARVSGGFAYSRYSVTRGGESDEKALQFDRALGRLKYAEQQSAPISDRLVLARVYLARGTREDARQALAILNQLEARGVQTAEALNDAGVAQFELGAYEEAIACFNKALAKSPGYNEALFNKALAEQHAGRNEDARQDWQVFLSHSPANEWKAEAEELLNSPGFGR